MKKEELKKYAQLIARTGANVQKNQPVVIFSSVNDEYFTKYVVEECYKAGASKVSVEWSSDVINKIVYKKTKTKDLVEFPNWQIEKFKYRRDTLPAMIYIESSDPDALADVDPKKIMAIQKVRGPIVKPIRKEMENKYQWTIVAIPSIPWAKKVFPGVSKKEAVDKLWDAIFKCARIYGDPIKNWDEHYKNIYNKCQKINSLGIDTLKYSSKNGTSFSVKMLKGLNFVSGGAYTTSGVFYEPNMPTEECFTSPDKESCEGVVYAAKPLSLNGKVLRDFGFRFEKGKVVEVMAKDDKTKNALTELINQDEGASRLGEVALVPFNSPINETGLLFYNTLFDENACCHLALGSGFEECIEGFENKSREELEAYGINDSIIHIDFMIGTEDLSIKAVLKDSKEIDIFKNGNWAI